MRVDHIVLTFGGGKSNTVTAICKEPNSKLSSQMRTRAAQAAILLIEQENTATIGHGGKVGFFERMQLTRDKTGEIASILPARLILRVLHFFKTYAPDSHGGVELFIFQLAHGMGARGIAVNINAARVQEVYIVDGGRDSAPRCCGQASFGGKFQVASAGR